MCAGARCARMYHSLFRDVLKTTVASANSAQSCGIWYSCCQSETQLRRKMGKPRYLNNKTNPPDKHNFGILPNVSESRSSNLSKRSHPTVTNLIIRQTMSRAGYCTYRYPLTACVSSKRSRVSCNSWARSTFSCCRRALCSRRDFASAD